MTKYRLDQIGKVIGGGTPSTRKKQYYANKGIAWITPKDLSGYSKMYISHGARDISQEGLDNSSAKLLPKDTVLVSSRAPIGYVALAANKITTNQGFKSIVPNTDIVLPKYLYYLMLTKKDELENVSSGSTFKEVSGRVMKGFEVDIPSLDKQANIIQKIEPITRKIELNYQINDNLDELLTTIFEEKVNSPKFSQRNLTDIANYRNGLAMQKFRPDNDQESMPVLKIKELNQGYTDGTSDRCSANIDPSVIVKIGDIIFSWSGTLLVKNWSGKTAGLNQHLFKVTSENYPDWFIYEWTKHHLRRFQSIAAGKATTMGHIKRKDLKDSTVYIPDNSYLTELDRRMKPIYNKRLEIIKENQELNNLRQALLQKYF